MVNTIYMPNTCIKLVDADLNLPSQNLTTSLENKHLDEYFYNPQHTEYYLVNNVKNRQVFASFFTYISAAGILLFDENYYLFIQRLGYWDIPKGKVEEGEKLETAAKRELKEETNLEASGKISPLIATAHCYLQNTQPIYKTTYWFLAKGNKQASIKLQTEENIDKAKWVKQDQIAQEILPYTYPTIRDVLKKIIKPI